MRSDGSPPPVSLFAAAKVWAKIGLVGFGGPAGQISLMHQELVERRRWIDEERFLHALNYCMLLPGPEAQQLATYIGWLLHRTAGGLVAGVLFVLPGAVAVLLLSILYASARELPAVAALLFGLKAAVLAVVIAAVLRIGRRALTSRLLLAVAAASFVALRFFAVPFPVVVLGAGLLGLLGRGGRGGRSTFAAQQPGGEASAQAAQQGPGPTATDGYSPPTVIDALAARGQLSHTQPSAARAARVLAVCAALWAAPMIALAAALGWQAVPVQEGALLSKAAVVSFGGAYAALAYVAQRAVEVHGWLSPAEMLDGLGLAETTPGPLILVVQFVAFVGAYRAPGALSPLAAGTLGAAVALWVTFVPCFLWIFLGAPYLEALRGQRALSAALTAITAAVVGVIANLAVWFGLHVLFGQVSERAVGPLHVLVPDVASFDPAAATLGALALVALLRGKLAVPKVLAGCAAAGAAWHVLR